MIGVWECAPVEAHQAFRSYAAGVKHEAGIRFNPSRGVCGSFCLNRDLLDFTDFGDAIRRPRSLPARHCER